MAVTESVTAVAVPGLQARARRRFRGMNPEGYLFVSPWLVGFVVFTAGPMLGAAAMAFLKWDIIRPATFIGVDNFTRLAHDPLVYKSLFNTAYYTFLGVPLQVLSALTMALLLNQRLHLTNVWRTVYYLPSITPAVASALLWMWILNPEFGLANAFLDLFGLPGQRWLWDQDLAKPTFILMSLWGIGNQMVILLAALQGVPISLYEAAQIEGAGSWGLFRHVTLPMISPSVFFVSIMGIIGSFQIFTTAYITTGAGPGNSSLFYVLYLYRYAFERFQMGYACALAWVLFAIILVFTLVQFRLAKHWVYYEIDVRS